MASALFSRATGGCKMSVTSYLGTTNVFTTAIRSLFTMPRVHNGEQPPTSTSVTGAQKRKQKKPYRKRPGTLAKLEIRREAKKSYSGNLNQRKAIKRAAFKRLAKEILQNFNPTLRFQRDAISALQEVAEDVMISWMEGGKAVMGVAKCETLTVEALRVARENALAVPQINKGLDEGEHAELPPQ